MFERTIEERGEDLERAISKRGTWDSPGTNMRGSERTPSSLSVGNSNHDRDLGSIFCYHYDETRDRVITEIIPNDFPLSDKPESSSEQNKPYVVQVK